MWLAPSSPENPDDTPAVSFIHYQAAHTPAPAVAAVVAVAEAITEAVAEAIPVPEAVPSFCRKHRFT